MFLPLGNRVVIKREPPSNKKGSLLLLDNSNNEKQKEGTVVSIGEKVTDVKVGDRVLISRHAGMPISGEQEDLLLVDVKEILGTFP